MMQGDRTPSLLDTASSIFKDNDHTEEDSTTAEENMKQPLIIVSSNESLKDEKEATTLSQERPSRSILCLQSFLFGSFISFALQGLTFVACTLVHMFGKKLQQPPDASGWPGGEAFLFVILYPMILYTVITKYSRALYLRKKFDKEDPSSSGSSIWTNRMLLLFGLYFAVGALVGSVSLWNGVVLFLSTGIVLPTILGTTVASGWVLSLIAVEFIEWRSHHRLQHQIQEQELEEDDSCFLV
jgi:hypothetical protein